MCGGINPLLPRAFTAQQGGNSACVYCQILTATCLWYARNKIKLYKIFLQVLVDTSVYGTASFVGGNAFPHQISLSLHCVMCPAYTTSKYKGCTKSIRPLVGKNTIIYFDVWNTNPLQSSLLGNAHTSSSGPAIAGNISGKLLVESCTAGLSHSA